MNLKYERSVFFCPMSIALVLMLLGVGSAEAQCNAQQIYKLLADDGAAGDNFGTVGISGTTAIVGAYQNDDNGIDSGSAYLFDTTTGMEIGKLLPGDAAAGDSFGFSVAISGSTALVSAVTDDDSGEDSGSAYLFDTTTGLQIAKLLAHDGAAGDYFGCSIAIDGTTAIIGAQFDDDNGDKSGSAYLFDLSAGRFTKLMPNDGAAGDQFGHSVAISNNVAIVGAWFDGDNGAHSGSAYLFDTTTGLQIAKLVPNDGAFDNRFGVSVGISGSTAVIGAAWDDDNGYHSGSAYFFDITTGQQLFKLLPIDGAEGDSFGCSVAIIGSTAVVGAWRDDDNGDRSGSAYLFDTTTGLQFAKLLADDGEAVDYFGGSVAISGTKVIIGEHFDDDNGENSGSAYLFEICIGPVCAGSGTLIEGTGEMGDFNAACGSDDSYWAAHGASLFFQVSDPVVQFELTATAPAGFGGSTISVDIEASKQSKNANLNLRALLYNFTTGSYVSLPGIMPLATTDAVQNFVLPGGSDPADFIEVGTDEVRLLIQTIQTSGLPNVRTQLDDVLFNFD